MLARVFTSLALLLLGATALFARDDIPETALSSPLDAAIFLNSKNDRAVDPEWLAESLFIARRYDDIRVVANNARNDYERFLILAKTGSKLLDLGERATALTFINEAYEIAKRDGDWSDSQSKWLLPSMIRLGKDGEAREVIGFEEDNEDKARLVLSGAETYLKIERDAEAREWLKLADEMRPSLDDVYLSFLATMYQKLKMKAEAVSVVETIVERAEQETDKNRRAQTYARLAVLFVKFNDWSLAERYWSRYEREADFEDILGYAIALSENGRPETATAHFSRLESDTEGLRRSGKWLVDYYVRKERIPKALRIAKMISSDVDSYEQQKALMAIADYYLRKGHNPRAIEIINYAFDRARRIVYSHRTQDSIGASPGSRKGQYLNAIADRLIELKMFDRALEVRMAIEADHDLARESLAKGFMNYAKQMVQSLPRGRINSLIARSNQLVKDDDHCSIEIKIATAEIHALLNEKTKAAELLSEAILLGVESCCYEEEALLFAGQVFETYKLQSTPELKNALLTLINDQI
ncbi:MAG: hypothetical protein JNL64_04015 [Blastocatellia bacterium]|nr:hypothetical protein [Blastocatellia bacterium]